MKKRLAAIEDRAPERDAIKKVELIQERRNLEVELATMGTKVDLIGAREGIRRRGEGLLRAQGHLVLDLARNRCPRRRAEEGRHHPRRASRRAQLPNS